MYDTASRLEGSCNRFALTVRVWVLEGGLFIQRPVTITQVIMNELASANEIDLRVILIFYRSTLLFEKS